MCFRRSVDANAALLQPSQPTVVDFNAKKPRSRRHELIGVELSNGMQYDAGRIALAFVSAGRLAIPALNDETKIRAGMRVSLEVRRRRILRFRKRERTDAQRAEIAAEEAAWRQMAHIHAISPTA